MRLERGDILDGKGEGGRAQKLGRQEENRPSDKTIKGAWGRHDGATWRVKF